MLCCGAYIDTAAAVGDLEQLQTTVLDQDVERGGPSVDGVFDEFLQRVHGCDNDLAGCNLVDHVWVQCLDASSQVGVAKLKISVACFALGPTRGVDVHWLSHRTFDTTVLSSQGQVAGRFP